MRLTRLFAPILLAAGVVGATMAFAQDTAELFTAIDYKRNARVAELLDQGMDPNVRSDAGYTPLMLAAASGNEEAVRILLDHGADPTLKSNLGSTALSRSTSYPVIQKLLKDALAARGEAPQAATSTAPQLAKGSQSKPLASSPAEKSKYYKSCYPLWGRDYSLCDSSDHLCKLQTTSRYQTCLKTGRYQ